MLPVVFLCIVVLGVIVAHVVFVKRRRRRDKSWQIDYSELEKGRLLGIGGYGEVHQAVWKGTEVAVKSLPQKEITTQLRKSFLAEVSLSLS